MRHPEYRYVDLAVGHISRRNNPTLIQKVKLLLKKDQPAYRTIGRFTDDYLKHWETHKNDFGEKTISGYNGKMFCDWLLFDFDNKEDVSKAHDDAIKFVESLKNNHKVEKESLLFFFSGAKGFHILLPEKLFGGFEPSINLPTYLKKIAIELSGRIKIDPSVYDIARMLRIANTKHPDSGLYKIQIKPDDFYGMETESIMGLAQTERDIFNAEEAQASDSLAKLYGKIKGLSSVSSNRKIGVDIDLTIPRGKKPCIMRILNSVTEKGERHNRALRLADYFKKEGYDPDMALAMILNWRGKCPDGMTESDEKKYREIIKKTYANEYDFGCNDPLLKSECGNGKDCIHIFTENQNGHDPKLADILDYEDLQQIYIEHIQTIDERRITVENWLPTLNGIVRGFVPGEVVMFLAGPGVGKTALWENMQYEIKKQSLFISLELPDTMIFERAMQIHFDKPGEEIERMYKEVDMNNLPSMERLKHMLTMAKSGKNLKEIARYVELSKSKFKSKGMSDEIVMVGIDYLGLVDAGGGNLYQVTSRLARGLKPFAKTLNVVTVVLVQTNRTVDEIPTKRSARDSGAIEESTDFLFGAYRPIEGDAPGNRMVIRILKSRRGGEGKSVNCILNPTSLKIREEIQYEENEIPYKNFYEKEPIFNTPTGDPF